MTALSRPSVPAPDQPFNARAVQIGLSAGRFQALRCGPPGLRGFQQDDWHTLLWVLGGQPPKPELHHQPLLQTASLLHAGQYVYAERMATSSHLQHGALEAFGLHLHVEAKLSRNLGEQAQYALMQAAEHWPDDELIQRSVELNASLIEVAAGEVSGQLLHVTLCRQMIDDGLSGLAALHLPHAMMTLALGGQDQGIREIAPHLPGFGTRGASDLQYGMALHVAGDLSGAREILDEKQHVESGSVLASRGRLHRALLAQDLGAMRTEVLWLTDTGLHLLLTRELRWVCQQLKYADAAQVFSAALRTHLGTQQNTQIHLTLMGEQPRVLLGGRHLNLRRNETEAALLLAVLTHQARYEQEVVPTEQLAAEVLSVSTTQRKANVQIAAIVHLLRQEIAPDVIRTVFGGYSLNPVYTVTLDLDVISRLLDAQKIRPAAELLAQGVLQGDRPGKLLDRHRHALYMRLFDQLGRAPRSQRTAELLRPFLPWRWPDETVEGRARQLHETLNA